MQSDSARFAADIGGTFTDVVLETAQRRFTCKVLTTQDQPERGVLEGVRQLIGASGLQPSQVGLFVHGTTLATNALIERKGACVALLTTAGFRDVLEMGFEKRFEQYDLYIERPMPLVPRPLRFAVPERIAADGNVLVELDEGEVERAAARMIEAGVEAVAIGFLHSYVNPIHERRARELMQRLLGGQVTVCVSNEVSPEMREYERFSTTCANAYVRPMMAGYLNRLRTLLLREGIGCPLLLMMSGGGLTTLESAMRFPIRLVESGPAGGAILAAHVAAECGLDKVMAFDLGGTTAKVCLIEGGEPERSRRFEVGRAYRDVKGSGLPLRIPVIELVEIGAGGGSIGRVDAMSRITVGPDSAGSEPGPACYGHGGTDATVTDANLVLGRLDPQAFAGGRIPLDRRRAEVALDAAIGSRLSMSVPWAAAGISEILEENMANAARVHAIERGKVIGDFAMIAFGGGAPLHAARLAQKLGIDTVVVPQGAGVGSAIGFLRAPVSFEVVRSERATLSSCDPRVTHRSLEAMHAEALEVVEPAAGGETLVATRLAELRYAGQGHELRIPIPEGAIDRRMLDEMRARFEDEYQRIYGLRIEGSEVEIVTWSLTLSTIAPTPARAGEATDSGSATPPDQRDVWEPALGEHRRFGLHRRAELPRDRYVEGPALIVEDQTTTVVPDGWRASLDDAGHLRLRCATALERSRDE